MSVTSEATRWSSTTQPAPWISEDWLSVWIGLGIFALALGGLGGVDLLGWVVSTSVWTDPGQALGTVSKTYAELGGAGALAVSFLALLAVLTAGAVALNLDIKRFAVAFTMVLRLPMGAGSSAATRMWRRSRLPISKNSASAGRSS